MAVDPVVVDDGGSTRITRLAPSGRGVIDRGRLVEVNKKSNPPQSSAGMKGPFTRIRVVTIDHTGVSNQAVDLPLVAHDTFTIKSGNRQIAVGAVDKAGKLTIALQGPAKNAPLVEARQVHKKMEYVVTNAGPIRRIVGTINGAPANLQVPAKNFYTAVVLS
jgi:hypothetical protein